MSIFVHGATHFAVLSVTSWAEHVSHRLEWGWSTTWHSVRTERSWKRWILPGSGAHLREQGLMWGVWGNGLVLKTKNDFLTGSNIPPRVTLGRNESLHHQDIKYFLGTFTLVMLLKGLREQMGRWHGCHVRSPLVAVILWSDFSPQILNQQPRAWSFTVTQRDVSRNDFPVAF